MNYPRVILAGTHSGVGKTTFVCGIMLALIKRGLNVQAFKAGPDYIDPSYHAEITGRASSNLDTWLLSRNTILGLFKKRAGDSDIAIIEGVMGLYDGLNTKEDGSTAHLAKILNSPVILILDAKSLSRSAAAIALGYRDFDRDVKIKGIILNNTGSENHYRCIKDSIESKTKIPVLGYLPRASCLKLPERHLGLVPTQEKKIYGKFYKNLLNLINKNIDLNRILRIAKGAQKLPYHTGINLRHLKKSIAIAVARDRAFNFYYEDNLDILKHFGARLIEFSPLDDGKLPRGIDGVYIGGGFPELFAKELSKNVKLKRDIYEKAMDWMPVYAECGGLMYLAEEIIDFEKRKFSMAGIFKGKVRMSNRLQALGYVEAEATRDNILSKKGMRIRGHVFHWSYLKSEPSDATYAYKVKNSKNNFFYDGLIKRNVLASYLHLHFASNVKFAENFVDSCLIYKGKRR